MSAAIETTGAGAIPEAPSPQWVALAEGPAGRCFAFDGHGHIALDTFLAEVRGVAAGLPQAVYAINLCEDR